MLVNGPCGNQKRRNALTEIHSGSLATVRVRLEDWFKNELVNSLSSLASQVLKVFGRNQYTKSKSWPVRGKV